MKVKQSSLALLLLSFSWFPAKSIGECSPIVLHFNERVPYAYMTAQGVKGLTAYPAQQAFEVAEIPYQWQVTPSKRQIHLIKTNKTCGCLVGWFKNANREKFAKYTAPLYQDQLPVIITRAGHPVLSKKQSLAEVLSDKELIMGAKEGYSYGTVLDEKIKQYAPRIDWTFHENLQMLIKVHAGRNDYFFLAPEEADGLIESSVFTKEAFDYLSLNGIPKGEKRHLLCSKQVSDKVIERLNAAIELMLVAEKQKKNE